MTSKETQGKEPQIDALLLDAIRSATKDRLVKVLSSVVENNAEASRVASNLLLTNAASTDSKKRSHTSDSAQTLPIKRRKRFKMCIQCEKEFDVTVNTDGSCTWHSGEREPNYESRIWADHDENVHGEIEHLEDEFPEGFQWNCCEKRGDDTGGCETGKHRSKLSADSDDSD